MDPKMKKFVVIVVITSCIKFLLMPSYRSTDFEVHRNWLSITHNLPLSKWYVEATSQWTLDYPPLFAWFEYGLSQLAPFFDPGMLRISAKTYETAATIFFQRFTVILTDLFYAYAAYQWCEIISGNRSVKRKDVRDDWFDPSLIVSVLFLFNPGLLIVDHIHFQYNGFLSGILLLSLARIVQKCELEAAFWFALLLNFKHIYLYVAPAYFIYLLKIYCFDIHMRFIPKNFLKLAAVTGGVFLFSFGPFIATGQLSQVLSRLFPFKRGLSHAYWAPNFWALYNAADKVLAISIHGKNGTAAMTGGLVQEYQHAVLPGITPIVTLFLVLFSMIPALCYLWSHTNVHLKDSWATFIRTVVISAFCSFIFGWHVHEKAILMVLIPLTSLSMRSKMEGSVFAFLTVVGTYSLFPLLYKSGETPTKLLLLLMYCFYCWSALTNFFNQGRTKRPLVLFNRLETLYMLGLVVLQFYESFGAQLLGLDKKLPFLPLLLTSIYCALGVVYSWIRFYIGTLRS